MAGGLAFAITFFADAAAASKREQMLDLSDLAERIETATGPDKASLPWLKMARFGERRSAKGSLRWDGNLEAITGVEADYDGDAEELSFDDAVITLGAYGILCLIYTSPSHTPERPRWRVLCPLAQEHAPGERARFLARLNGLFGGIFANESWTLSQSYYYGSVTRDGVPNPAHQVETLDGIPIDQLEELDEIAIGRPEKPKPAATNGSGHTGPATPPEQITDKRLNGKINSLLANISAAADGAKHHTLWDNGVAIGGYLHLTTEWSDAIAAEACLSALAKCDSEVKSWEGARRTAGEAIAAGRQRPCELEDRPGFASRKSSRRRSAPPPPPAQQASARSTRPEGWGSGPTPGQGASQTPPPGGPGSGGGGGDGVPPGPPEGPEPDDAEEPNPAWDTELGPNGEGAEATLDEEPPPSSDEAEQAWRDTDPNRAPEPPEPEPGDPRPEPPPEDVTPFNPADWLTVSDQPWDMDALPPRPWVAPPYLMRQQITLLHGPGAAGKSQLTISWATGLALGRSFGRLDPRGRFRVMLANFEDDEEEVQRRLSAALLAFGASPADLKGYLFRVSLGPKGDATMFEVGEKDGVIRTTDVWAALERHCEEIRPDVVMGDPLVAMNAVPENDNQLIRRVMTVLKIGMARRFNCALVIAHHDVKSGGAGEDSDQTNARGAGDIVNAVRCELAVKKMTVEQAETMNVDPKRRGWFFRVGSIGSKINYFEAQDSEWMQRLTRPISGESTVYCEPWEPPPVALDQDKEATLIRAIAAGTKWGPYSPYLRKRDDRSLAPVLKGLDIVTAVAQRHVMKRLKDSGEVEQAKFRRPGHGTEFRAGLRTVAGEPRNCEWKDFTEEDPDGAEC